ncbi:hypothetical protein B0H19DRAFT_1081909 [Mycena capillaripes]|nr:hypothetical protein B0H19DRAFT_1081909 [Mycena capillaripes]
MIGAPGGKRRTRTAARGSRVGVECVWGKGWIGLLGKADEGGSGGNTGIARHPWSAPSLHGGFSTAPKKVAVHWVEAFERFGGFLLTPATLELDGRGCCHLWRDIEITRTIRVPTAMIPRCCARAVGEAAPLNVAFVVKRRWPFVRTKFWPWNAHVAGRIVMSPHEFQVLLVYFLYPSLSRLSTANDSFDFR